MAGKADDRTIDERQPLLDHGSQHHVANLSHRNWWSGWVAVPVSLRIKNTALVPILGMLTVFLNESEFYFKQAATVRALEAMACLEHYAQIHDPVARLGKKIPETMCKTPAIQERVAKLYGAAYGIRMVCAVTGTALLISFFSTGTRRPILIAHKLNLIFTQALTLTAYFGYPKVPIWLICFNGIFALVGGNFDLGISTVFASYADVISDPTKRSTLIFVTSSLQYASQAICLPIASRLINLDGQGTTPEVALWVSCVCAVVVFLITLLFYPETSRSGKAQSSAQHSVMLNPAEAHSSKPFQVLKHDFGLLKISFLLLSMLGSVTASRLIDWYGLMQYPSVKFHWVLSKTMLLVTLLAILSFFNFSLLLPQFNKLCTRILGLPPRISSLVLSLVSALAIVVACVLMGLPTTTIAMFVGASAIYTFGSGINSAIHAYTVNVANDTRASGMALTVLSLGATGGKVLASILWPVLLETGLEADGGSGKWAGLPFLAAGAMAIVSTGAMAMAEWAQRRSRGKAREVGYTSG